MKGNYVTEALIIAFAIICASINISSALEHVTVDMKTTVTLAKDSHGAP
ncbi:hypothetical protein [Thauera aromatica]|nr:hypothetical protein [Thauera aromatica]MCK2095644.1 hypothetical protein [Thauera aromatica]